MLMFSWGNIYSACEKEGNCRESIEFGIRYAVEIRALIINLKRVVF